MGHVYLSHLGPVRPCYEASCRKYRIYLQFRFHHIITDGFGAMLIINDIVNEYRGLSQGHA